MQIKVWHTAAGLLMGVLLFVQIAAVGCSFLLRSEKLYLNILSQHPVISSFTLTREQVRADFETMASYLQFPQAYGSQPFRLPYLKDSESGTAHFEAVRVRFRWLYAAGAAAFMAELVLAYESIGRKKRCRPVLRTAAVVLLLLTVLTGAAVFLSFSDFFEGMHEMLFPAGGFNLNPFQDPVVLYLPAAYFQECAEILTAAELSAGAAVILFLTLFRK